MYQVRLTNPAEKGFKKLDRRYRDKALASLRRLCVEPFLGEKMGGEFRGYYRVKIPPIRIVYIPDFKSKIIWVRAIGHRQGVYN